MLSLMGHQETDLNAHLGAAIAARLESAGISQRNAALRTYIPLTSLNAKLAGAREITAKDLVRLAVLLDTAPSDLLREAEVNAALLPPDLAAAQAAP